MLSTAILRPAAKDLTVGTLIFLLLCAYIILTPVFDLLPVIGRYDEKRLLECLLLLFISISLITQPAIRDNWIRLAHQLPANSRYLLACLVTLGLLSAVGASAPEKAILEISLYILLFITCLYTALQRQRLEQHFDTLITNALLITSAFSLVAFSAAFMAAMIEPVPLLHWDLFVNFSHIRFFSQFQSWTLPLIVLPLLLNRSTPAGLRLWLPLFLAGSWWFLLFASGTRGSLLGLIVAAIVIAIAFGRHALPWFKWQGLALLIGLSLYILLFLLPPLLGNADTGAIQNGTIGRSLTNSSHRYDLWLVAWSMITEHPLLGIGPMHYACGITNGIAAHPHNAVLQIAAEWGLPAALIVIFLLLNGARAWICQGRARLATANAAAGYHHPMLYPALLGSLTTATTHALFSGIINMPLSQITMTLVIGWMIGIYYRPADTFSKKPVATIAIWIILVLAASAGLISGITPDLLNFGELLNINHIPAGLTHYMPRFWQQGLICG